MTIVVIVLNECDYFKKTLFASHRSLVNHGSHGWLPWVAIISTIKTAKRKKKNDAITRIVTTVKIELP